MRGEIFVTSLMGLVNITTYGQIEVPTLQEEVEMDIGG